MNDMNLLALFFYIAALSWGVTALSRLIKVDLAAALAMFIVCGICIEGGYKRWGTEPRTVVVGPVLPPISR